MAYTVTIIEYGEAWDDDTGAFNHPHGGTCALTVLGQFTCVSPDEALDLGILWEQNEMVYRVIVEEGET